MKKILSRVNNFHIEILFLLIVGLIPLLWYKDGYIAFGHDMGFSLFPTEHFLDRLYTWTDRLGPFGSNDVQVLPGIFIHGLEALFSYLGFSTLGVQKITYIFWFVLPGLAMYTLLHFLHPKKEDYPIRLSGSIFYMMNHYLLQAWTIAERTKFSIVVALPLVILLIIKVLHKKESPVKNSILLALTLFFFNGGEGIPLLISLFIALITAALVFFFLSDERFWPKLKRLLIFSTLSALFWIALSSYWLYPYLTSYNQAFGQRFDDAWGTSGAISWSQSISTNTSWINLFRLRGIPGWYDSPDHPYANEFFSNPLLLFLNFVFPILALISLIKIKKLSGVLFKSQIYFLILLLISVPLAAGSHPPLGILFDYLLVNLPGFLLFRSSFLKFGMLIWFVYAYLIAIGVKEVIDWIKMKPKYRKYVSLVFLAAFIVSLFIYNYPFFTGGFFNYAAGKSTMVKVPGYVYDAKKDLDQNKFSTRTLSLPNVDLRTEYVEYDWKYFSLSDLSHMMGRRSFVADGVLARPNERDLITGIQSEYIHFGSSNLLKFTGVDKAILQNDYISPDYEGNPVSGIKDSFKSSHDFSFNNSLGRWDFYNYNKETLPQIYSPEKIAFVSSLGPDLYLAANLPSFSEEDAFVWSDTPADSKKAIYDKLTIQAACADCPPAESYQIYFAPSKVLRPGRFLYEIGKALTDLRYLLTKSPTAKIDMKLSSSTTLISDIGYLQAKSGEKGISVASRDLTRNMEEIKSSLDQISDPKVKQLFLKKVRFYLSFFVSYESQWATSAVPGKIKTDLTKLETELKDTASFVEYNIGEPKIEVDQAFYNYRLDIPQAGDYTIYVYQEPSLARQTILTINNKSVGLNKHDKNWLNTGSMRIDLPSVLLKLPKSKESDTRPVIFAQLSKEALNSTSPTIEFVALNQTKYLVRTRGTDGFLLGFNSRYDPNWSLREIKQDVSPYFKGNTKVFQNGKIVEYERQDSHVLTDIAFPTYGKKLYPTLELNGLSSGWVLDSKAKNPTMEHTYLLEYNNQNDFYKAAGVSIVSLLLISAFYLLRYGPNKN